MGKVIIILGAGGTTRKFIKLTISSRLNSRVYNTVATDAGNCFNLESCDSTKPIFIEFLGHDFALLVVQCSSLAGDAIKLIQ